jgi:Holliday junction resolvasome RuvABC endonuclease subunit
MPENKRYLSLDPSSTCVGWAVFTVEEGTIAAGRIRGKGKAATGRIDALVDAVASLAKEHSIDSAIVEVPSGKVHAGRNRGGGSGLSVYGEAVGAIRTALRLMGLVMHSVTAERWTGGHSKVKRRRVALKEYPALDGMTDGGGDISDAIALGVWYRLRIMGVKV